MKGAAALLSPVAQLCRDAAEGIPASPSFLDGGGMFRRSAAPSGQGQARGHRGVLRRALALDDQRERAFDELFFRGACHDAAAQAKSSASFASKPVRVETVVCSISSDRSAANTREQSMAARSRCLATAISVMFSCRAISARVCP